MRSYTQLLLAGVVLCIVTVQTGLPLRGQSEAKRRPVFEVASIKPIGPTTPLTKLELGHGSLRVGTTVIWLITLAFDLSRPLVEGSPSWTEQEFFDIDARGEPSADSGQIKVMLQSLLAERFNLRVHREKKEMPAYLLTVAQQGKLPKESKEGTERDADGSILMHADGLTGRGATMTSLCEFLWEGVLQQPVRDDTKLSGAYDFSLLYDRHDPMSIVVALRRSGLDLRKANVQFEVLYVDHIERPSRN